MTQNSEKWNKIIHAYKSYIKIEKNQLLNVSLKQNNIKEEKLQISNEINELDVSYESLNLTIQMLQNEKESIIMSKNSQIDELNNTIIQKLFYITKKFLSMFWT